MSYGGVVLSTVSSQQEGPGVKSPACSAWFLTRLPPTGQQHNTCGVRLINW